MGGSARLFATSAIAALTLAAGAMLGQPAAAVTQRAAISPSAPFTISISGIDRDGTALTVSASVYGQNGVSYLSGGTSVAVPAGHYIVAAPIWRPADGSTQTLVARRVHVTANTHVTLNAQGAVPVASSLVAPGTTQGPQTVELCLHAAGEVDPVTGFLVESPGTVFVKPMTGAGLQTVYQTYWQGTGTLYDVADAFSGGIPADPVYHASPATMAKVHVQLRANENVTPLRAVLETFDSCGSTSDPVTLLPADYTDFRSPGDWSTDLDFGPASVVQRDLFKMGDYKAGHSYTDLFSSAAAGPSAIFPEIDGSDVVYSPGNLFSDPVIRTGFDCEGKAGLKLMGSAGVIKTTNLKFCAKTSVFSAHVKKAGWVTLSASARRWNPAGSLPAGFLLSPKVSMSWHFRFAPVRHHPINAQAAPVTVTRFVPQGLGFANNATGGTTTGVRCYILRGGGEPAATPRYRLSLIRIQASFDDGASWHTLAATTHGGYLLVHVHDPNADGYVSLRSVVTDVHGDRTTETVSRAYLVQNGN